MYETLKSAFEHRSVTAVSTIACRPEHDGPLPSSLGTEKRIKE